jgi:DNA-binding transcriptional LysR family regulator
MDIRNLRYFAAAAHSGSFSRAAQDMNVVQSAISHQIRLLEEELGTELFSREGRAVRLTAAGAQLLADAELILRMVADSKSRIMRLVDGEAGSLRIGFQSATCRRTIVSETFQRLRSQYPNVTLDLLPMTGLAMQDAICKSEMDGGFFYYSGENPALSHRVLHQDDWTLALPRNHPLAAMTELKLHNLSVETFIWLPRRVTPILYDRMLAACSAGGLTPNIVQEAFDEAMVLNLVAVGLGIAFVLDSLPADSQGNVIFKRVSDFSVPNDLCFVWKTESGNPVLPKCLDLIEALATAETAPAMINRPKR